MTEHSLSTQQVPAELALTGFKVHAIGKASRSGGSSSRASSPTSSYPSSLWLLHDAGVIGASSAMEAGAGQAGRMPTSGRGLGERARERHGLTERAASRAESSQPFSQSVSLLQVLRANLLQCQSDGGGQQASKWATRRTCSRAKRGRVGWSCLKRQAHVYPNKLATFSINFGGKRRRRRQLKCVKLL